MCIRDSAKTFSVVFDKSGRLVTHNVRVWNRSGRYDDQSTDDIFNTVANIAAGVARFVQDNYTNLGLGEESSRNCFYVVQRSAFEAIDPTKRWSRFLQYETVRYVNPFSGEIVNQEVRP